MTGKDGDFIDNDAPLEASADALDAIKTEVEHLRNLECEIESLERTLSQRRDALNKSQLETLPHLLRGAGLTRVALTDGVEVSCGPCYRANIPANWPEDKRAAAFKWLDDNGHGDLIKTDVAVAFARDQRSEAQEAVKQLSELGYAPSVKESVHHGTLSAWLREQIEDGRTVPLETIGGFVGEKATVKVKK